MYVSIFELFKIGIGPSSSHTVGPMVAANKYITHILPNINQLKSINIELFGSLAHTGYGHKINNAIIMGLTGLCPENIQNSTMKKIIKLSYNKKKLNINNSNIIDFNIGRYVKENVDIYSVITFNSQYDAAFETEINMILMDKLNV